MAMSVEQREAASTRMKLMHATGKIARKRPNQPSSMAVSPCSPEDGYLVKVAVDWEKLTMEKAQQAYAILKKEFERAGFILNQRSSKREDESYVCFMCKSKHLGLPRGTDYSYVNPQTGLMQPVFICGEKCWLDYQGFRIRERKERELVPRSS